MYLLLLLLSLSQNYFEVYIKIMTVVTIFSNGSDALEDEDVVSIKLSGIAIPITGIKFNMFRSICRFIAIKL